jgi:hypothetical protein
MEWLYYIVYHMARITPRQVTLLSTPRKSGYSDYSNEVITQTPEIPPLELDVDCYESPPYPEHYHWLDWTFDYQYPSRFIDYTVEYRYLWQGTGLGEPTEWSPWDTLMVTDNMLLIFHEHDEVNTGGCYQYRVTANVEDGSRSDSYLISHDYDCEEDPPPGGCPVVSNWDGEQFRDDNNILAMSEIDGGAMVNFYKLKKTLVSSEGNYYLKIMEDEQEHSYIDNMMLLVVDHLEGVKVGVTQGGKIFGYSQKSVHQRCKGGESRSDSDTEAFST